MSHGWPADAVGPAEGAGGAGEPSGPPRPESIPQVVADLRHIVADSLATLRRMVRDGVAIELRADRAAAVARLDAGAVRQMLASLVTNARDAMPEGGRVVIDVGPTVVRPGERGPYPWLIPGRYARVSVQDDGVGMDDATRLRAFEPGFTTKPPGMGSGVGLFLVHDAVQRHGGLITLRSRLGEGTTVTLYFPEVAMPD